MELEEQRRALFQRHLRVLVDGIDLRLVQQLDARQAEAQLDRLDDGAAGAFQGFERAHGREDRLGYSVQLHCQFSNDTECALRADEKACQIVTGGGLARTAACPHDRAVSHYRGNVEHVLAHRSVKHGVGARGAGRRHTTKGGFFGAGVDWKE